MMGRVLTMKRSLLLILFLIINAGGLRACWIDATPDVVPMFVSVDIRSIEPDFKSESPDDNESDREQLVSEWKAYLGKNAGKLDIEKVLFDDTVTSGELASGKYSFPDAGTRDYLIFLKRHKAVSDQPAAGDEKKENKNPWDIFGLINKTKKRKPAILPCPK